MVSLLTVRGAYEDGLGRLGDPTRRAIFGLLARNPCSVGELARQLPVTRPAVSQHLRLLKDGGLAVSRPRARATCTSSPGPG